MRKGLACFLVVLLAAPAGLAQTQEGRQDWSKVIALRLSTSLNIDTRDGKSISGKLANVSAEKLSLTSKKLVTEYDRATISRVYRPRKSFGKSAAFGSLIGAGAGAGVGAAVFDGKGWLDPGRGEGAAIFAVLGAGVGALTGLVLRAVRHKPTEIYRAP